MLIDCHVHVAALTPGRGKISPRLMNSLPFRFMKWRLGVSSGPDQLERLESAIREMLFGTLEQALDLDRAVVLAFDAVYDREGRRDENNTHLHVANDYVLELARQHAKILFGASVHPYRKDALAELERCIKAGAVLVKWLPITQDIDPADQRCIGFYECLAHHKVALLSHTGGEHTLPNLNGRVASPALLEEAARRGVKVIAAHCGTRSAPFEQDYVDDFVRLARKYEHFYGDTSALNLPMRWHAYGRILRDREVMRKVIHGSDWPVISIPPLTRLPLHVVTQLLRERNWISRDIKTKRRLGFDDEYWDRAASVLRVTASK